MSLLRIYGSLREEPLQCQWTLLDDGQEPVFGLVGDGQGSVFGEGTLAQLPQRADRVQLVLPAADVLIARAHLPQSAKRHAGALLAYAVEDEIIGDPDANQASWIGSLV
ncbi:MAG: type II secretion system protein GspL, partial [Georgfuchsia sp.]